MLSLDFDVSALPSRLPSSTAAVFTGALWVQHAREAWPFAPDTPGRGSAERFGDALGRGHRLHP